MKTLKAAWSVTWTEATWWGWGFVLAAGACIGVYLAGLAFWEVRPGSVLGTSYGISATVLMLGAACFGVRRRTMRLSSRLGLGRARGWLLFHVYGGALFLLLVWMHTAFRWPTGTLSWCLWLLSLWTVASGMVGLVLQKWIPRVLASGLSVEVNYERVPELAAEIRQRSEEMVASCSSAVRSLYERKIAPVLAAPRRDLIFFFDVTGGARRRLKELEYLHGLLPADEKEKLREIERLYQAKLEIDAHYTLQQVLRGWLYGHVPLTLVLVVLVGLHIFTVLYY